jgi:NADH:ubiquinone oxidoreductase subunit 3 (subunit A)
MFEYLFIGLFLSFLLFLFIFLILIPQGFFLFFYQDNGFEKISVYECGFEPFSGNTIFQKFSLDFLIIALLFLIFDVELFLLIPWLVNFAILGIFGFFIFLLFLFILVFGWCLEYLRGFLGVEIRNLNQ